MNKAAHRHVCESTSRPDSVHKEIEGTRGEWVSWKTSTRDEDESVVRLSLSQCLLRKRMHTKLNHYDDATRQLPEELQFENKKITEYDHLSVTSSFFIRKSNHSQRSIAVVRTRGEAYRRSGSWSSPGKRVRS